MTKMESVKRIVFYDGECGFCNSSVRTFLKLDSKGVIQYAPLQGETAKQLLPNEYRGDNLDTLIYLRVAKGKDAELFVKSEAVFEILSDIGGFVSLLSIFKIIPISFRDWVYMQVSRHRHKIKISTACELPDKDKKERFLE
jgi:predicted DCC family thiol-disulfide oxidoreductase YuxK